MKDDTKATIEALKSLDAKLTEEHFQVILDGIIAISHDGRSIANIVCGTVDAILNLHDIGIDLTPLRNVLERMRK